jgi:signal transduction histidine kinase
VLHNYRNWPQSSHAGDEPTEPCDAATSPSGSALRLDMQNRSESRESADFPISVQFTAKPSLEIVSVAESVTALLGFSAAAVVGRPEFWQESVDARDWALFQKQVSELERSGAVSFMHRIIDGFGLPVWLSHRLRRVERDGDVLVDGCLVPIQAGICLTALDQDVVARFIHKLGNHFQLLNLAVNALKKSLPDCRENDILEESLDKAIDLTKIFSDCNQSPSLSSNVQLLEVLRGATGGRVSQFAAAGVRLETHFEEVPENARIASDPYLLETALGHILQNALEAIEDGGSVQVGVRLMPDSLGGVARIYVRDSGCGIPAGDVAQVTLPFYSTKKGHDGLGLTVASRYIELHGGTLRISSREGVGTEAEVLIPMEHAQENFSG